MEEIQELYREYWQYMIDKDEDGLRRIMSEDYYLLHMTGVKQTADAFLAGLKDGTFNYYAADHDSIEAEANGDNCKDGWKKPGACLSVRRRKEKMETAGRLYTAQGTGRLETYQLKSFDILRRT